MPEFGSENPRGRNEVGWSSSRYGAYHDFAAWRRYLTGAGFTEILHYYRPPGLPRDQQPWLASAWRKPKYPARQFQFGGRWAAM